jgi:very-short-patch-repair endonuclease
MPDRDPVDVYVDIGTKRQKSGLDGRPYHLAVQDIERDRLKDAKLLAQGIRPLRVTDQRFDHDPEGAIEDLKALLQFS